MLIYGYRGKKCPVSTDINNDTNLWALIRYNKDFFQVVFTSVNCMLKIG